ncbi:MAG: type I restriction enzyme HsdR N-terminal domain-containing protein [Nitrospirota bacterium]
MSEYIFLGKVPESPEDRQKLLAQRAAMEDYFVQAQLTQVQRRVAELLTVQKGYSLDDIEANKEFTIELPDGSFCVTADFVLKHNGRRFMVVKCVMSSMESWERHAVAFCRVVEPCQIPLAVVTDSEAARVLDAVTGAPVGEGMEAIPSREDAERIVRETVFTPYPAERAEREKRILFAFDAIKCSTKLSGEEE